MQRLVLSLTVLAALTSHASAAFIVNGDFETSTFTGTNMKIMSSGNTNITGWTTFTPPGPNASSSQNSLYASNWQAHSGTWSVALNGPHGAGGIEQTVTGLVANGIYAVTFFMSGNPNDTKGVRTLVADILGDPPNTYTYNTKSVANGGMGNTLGNMLYQSYTFNFKASGATELLRFYSTTAGNRGPVIDDVSIAVVSVPLPASLGLLLAGLPGFGVGWVLRRKGAKATEV